jgi:hypothetical protein
VEKVNVAQKFDLFSDYWSPKIAAELNDSYVKLAKLKGEFVWHHHENEDELFLVTKGQLLIKLRDGEVRIGAWRIRCHSPWSRTHARGRRRSPRHSDRTEDDPEHRQCRWREDRRASRESMSALVSPAPRPCDLPWR